VGDSVGNDFNGEALGIADRLVPGLAIAHDAGQLEGLRDPAPVFFPIELDRQIHSLIIPPPANRGAQLTAREGPAPERASDRVAAELPERRRPPLPPN
jgi:hypothetical protein